MDGQDGNVLQLEYVRRTFSTSVPVSCKTHYSQSRSGVPVVNGLMNSLMEN